MKRWYRIFINGEFRGTAVLTDFEAECLKCKLDALSNGESSTLVPAS